MAAMRTATAASEKGPESPLWAVSGRRYRTQMQECCVAANGWFEPKLQDAATGTNVRLDTTRKDLLGAHLLVPHSPGVVDVGRLTLRTALDDTLARVVVFVVLRLP